MFGIVILNIHIMKGNIYTYIGIIKNIQKYNMQLIRKYRYSKKTCKQRFSKIIIIQLENRKS